MNCTPEQALQKLIDGNKMYLSYPHNTGSISPDIREQTAAHGQQPYAVVLTCSDSRVPPEHIFSAGIGELFVVRTAGNVVGGFELGTIEYGIEHLRAPLILIMGHTQCGAVAAALKGHGHAEGYINNITHEIHFGLNGASDEDTAVRKNIFHSKQRIMESAIIQNLVYSRDVSVACALYDIKTGKVEFFNC